MVQGPTYPLELNSARRFRAKENSCGDLLATIIDTQKKQSKRNTTRASIVCPSNKSRKYPSKNDASFQHQLLVIDKRLSAIERNGDSIKEDQARLRKKLARIADEQNIIRNQQANIAEDQDRIGREFADIRKEHNSIRQEQDNIESEHREIRLVQEDIRNGFSHLRSEFCQRRRSLDDLRKRFSAIAEDQANIRCEAENNMEKCESLGRSFEVLLGRFQDEEGEPIVDEHCI